MVRRGVTARVVRERKGVVVRERLDLDIGVLGKKEGDRKSPN